MTQRLIRKVGDPVLREECQPVKNISYILKLLDDMAETLHATSNGAALAAPQIGVTKRIVVMDCGEGLIELINPEIVSKKGKQVGPEGCLSFPGIFGEVKRASNIVVKALNRHGEEFVIEAEGFIARCLQHEIDHLNGTLFIDYVAPGQLYNEDTNTLVDVVDLRKISRQNKE